MDHFGIKQFPFVSFRISGCFARKLMERAPGHVGGVIF
jgi:hypothetical protein